MGRMGAVFLQHTKIDFVWVGVYLDLGWAKKHVVFPCARIMQHGIGFFGVHHVDRVDDGASSIKRHDLYFFPETCVILIR